MSKPSHNVHSFPEDTETIIHPVQTKKDKRRFRDFPSHLHKGQLYWVPMLRSMEAKVILKEDSPVLKGGPHQFFLALKNNQCVGRICVGIDKLMNQQKGQRHAHFFFFDCIDDRSVARKLLGSAEEWALQQGMDMIKGPISFTNGDDFRGMLLEGFDRIPPLFLAWNPPYYPHLMEGYEPMFNYSAFEYDLQKPISQDHEQYIERVLEHYGSFEPEQVRKMSTQEKIQRLFPVAFDRFGYSMESPDFSNIPKVAEDLKFLLNEANQDLQEDLRQFTLEDCIEIIKEFKKMLDPSLVVFCVYGGKKVGLAVCIPNFNPIIQRIHGKLLPFGWIRFLREKNRMKNARGIIFYINKEHFQRGISALMILKLHQNLTRMGFRSVEFATIEEKNASMMMNIRYLGLTASRKYVVYGKGLCERRSNPMANML